jgi:TolB-like protein/DNA-binding winged helix-turn-helix (wHTH) protein/Flp pilus assembly protein TadD
VSATRFQFADFEMDLARYELRHAGRAVKLEKIPMELLILLLRRKGELVSREEINERVWGKDVFVDTEQGINTAIRKIRQALHDDPDEPRFIQTVTGKGYRFIPAVREEGPGAEQDVPSQAVPAPAIPSPRPRSRMKFAWVAAALTLVAALIAFNVGGLRDRLFSRAAPPIRSLAVLPLENLSADPAQEYFADGLTDELITQLARRGSLRVISRMSVMHYKASKQTIPEIARELNVDAVVEGSVSRDGNTVRIRAQLIYAPTDEHLWAESFTREMRDVLALQEDVASAIAHQVQTKLAPEGVRAGVRPRAVEPAVIEAYLRGRAAWNRRNEAGLREAVELFQQAVALDPSYAPAYSGLADSYTTLGYFSYLSPQESFPPARTAAHKALELNPTLAEPHASLAYIKFYYDWDWKAAEQEFQKALVLNPNYATAHHWYSVYLTAMGRPDEAMAEIQKARSLDPFSPAIQTDIGFQLYYTQRYDEAIRHLTSTLEMNPNLPLAHLWLGRSYQEKGMYAEALAEFAQAEKVMRNWAVTIAARGMVLGLAGKRQEAHKALTEMRELAKKRYVTAYGVALVYAGLGEKDQAFVWLQRGVEEHTHWLVWTKLDPRWNSLRDDPRFEQVLRRVGLPN